MTTILKLNEEQQGLKLIQVNDGFVVVDLSNKYQKDDYVYDAKDNVIRFCKGYLPDNFLFKIIFATANLNLEGVPEIDNNIIPLLQMAEKLFIDFKRENPIVPSSDLNPFKLGFIKGYKQAKQNLFTEEQVIEAVLYGMQKGLAVGKVEETDFDWVNNFIQSLKQPKVEITFEDGKPIKCVLC